MAQVPREFVDGYIDAVNTIVGKGQDGLKSALKAIDYNAEPATVRQQVLQAMQQACGASAEMGARVSAAFYDGVRAYSIGETLGASSITDRKPIATEKAVRAFLKSLFDGNVEEFEDLCLERLAYETKRAAGQCVRENVDRDEYGDTRYARVPTGEKTCDFCIMLASRGPVYRTEESAGAYDHYHANCDCAVVPFFGTYESGPSRRDSAFTEVEGYDPDSLYEEYCQMMLDPSFRDRMARAADKAKHPGRESNARGHETSHPMLWEQAKREGKVQFGSVAEVENYFLSATSYQDLFDRIKVVNKEVEYYGLSRHYLDELQKTLNRARDKVLGIDRAAERREIERKLEGYKRRAK